MEKNDENAIRLMTYANVLAFAGAGALVGLWLDNANLNKLQALEGQVQAQQGLIYDVKSAAGSIEAQAHSTSVNAAINHTIQKDTAKLNKLTAEAQHIHTHELLYSGAGIGSGALGAIALGYAAIFVQRHRRAHKTEVNQPTVILS